MIYALDEAPSSPFPPVMEALDSPNGLLAVGGCLSPERLINAYSSGIFPWFSEDEPILWWSPNPRLVLYPEEIHISKSMQKLLRQNTFDVRVNQNFSSVIDACAAPRTSQPETWILPEMKAAYITLHDMGVADSVECYQDNQLVGGLYGVKLGRVFFGESMFSHVSNASKYALIHLCREIPLGNTNLIDCQVYSDHLAAMGAREISREEFSTSLKQLVE